MSNFFKKIIRQLFNRPSSYKAIADSVKRERDTCLNSILLTKVEQFIGRIPTALEMNENYSVEHEGIRKFHKWSGVTLFTVVDATDL